MTKEQLLAKQKIDNFSYYGLQHAINDFLKSIRAGTISKELDKIIETPEVQAIFTAQHPYKTYDKTEIVNHFGKWISNVLHPIDAFRIYKAHYEALKNGSMSKTRKDEFRLFNALTSNDIELVKELLAKGVDVNAQDEDGYTPLIIACRKGRTEIIKLLLKHKDIDFNTQGRDKETALMKACIYNHVDAAKLLLERKDININFESDEGYTALKWAIEYKRAEIINLLEQRGIK